MQITSTTAMPAASGGWAKSTDQTQDATATADIASALGIPVGDAGENQSQSAEESEFGGAMAMAELLAGSAKADPKVQTGIGMSPLGEKQSSKGPSIQASGKLDKNIPRGVGGGEEQGSLIQRMAVSSNTGAEIAGLKPWSKEWVMEGGLNRHPSQKTLIPGEARGDVADATSQLAELARLMKEASTEQPSQSALNPNQVEAAIPGQSAQGVATLEMQEAGLQGLQPQASREASPRKRSMSGDDFLSLRQAVHSGAAEEQGAQSAIQSGRSIKVLPGGTAAAVADRGQGLSSSTIKERPLQGGASKNPLTTGIGNDTLGLIHPEMNGKAAVAGASVLPFPAAAGSLKMDGSVVPGAMQRNRLSSESVLGVTQNIQSLSTSGGGEIRIRLKPDHLGELSIRVSSTGKSGNEIGLKIQASDERAKKILEESISSLKDNLSGQNLNLSKVEVQVSNALSASNSSSSGQFDAQSGSQNPFNQNNGDFGAALDQGGRQQFERGGERGEWGRPEGLRSSATKAFSTQASRSNAGSGRIDVMA